MVVTPNATVATCRVYHCLEVSIVISIMKHVHARASLSLSLLAKNRHAGRLQTEQRRGCLAGYFAGIPKTKLVETRLVSVDTNETTLLIN